MTKSNSSLDPLVEDLFDDIKAIITQIPGLLGTNLAEDIYGLAGIYLYND
jgi:hypothetical protein